MQECACMMKIILLRLVLLVVAGVIYFLSLCEVVAVRAYDGMVGSVGALGSRLVDGPVCSESGA
jgi:hypothetical protein